MKTIALLLALLLAGCTSADIRVSPAQVRIANAVEDALTVGLVPVLAKNPAYLDAARAVAAGLGTFSGATITPADVDAVLARVPGLTPADSKAIAAIVNASWSVYVKRYSAEVNTSLRPDVALFLRAVAGGINAAIAAVPKS